MNVVTSYQAEVQISDVHRDRTIFHKTRIFRTKETADAWVAKKREIAKKDSFYYPKVSKIDAIEVLVYEDGRQYKLIPLI